MRHRKVKPEPPNVKATVALDPDSDGWVWTVERWAPIYVVGMEGAGEWRTYRTGKAATREEAVAATLRPVEALEHGRERVYP